MGQPLDIQNPLHQRRSLPPGESLAPTSGHSNIQVGSGQPRMTAAPSISPEMRAQMQASRSRVPAPMTFLNPTPTPVRGPSPFMNER